MAKSTNAQEVATGTSDSYTPHELSDPAPPIKVTRAMLGEVPCPPETEKDGGDSSTSSDPNKQAVGLKQQHDPSLVPNAENPSSLPGELSDAPTTDGSGTAPSLNDEEEEPYADWTYAELQQECKERELPATGKTEDLINRLIADDEAADTDELE
jgi:hypothetical protein